MQTTTVRLYSLGYGQAKTYWTAFLFVAGNVLLPQLCHLFPLGGVRWLPIYFFTLVGAYKYRISVSEFPACCFRFSGDGFLSTA